MLQRVSAFDDIDRLDRINLGQQSADDLDNLIVQGVVVRSSVFAGRAKEERIEMRLLQEGHPALRTPSTYGKG